MIGAHYSVIKIAKEIYMLFIIKGEKEPWRTINSKKMNVEQV